MKSNKKKLEYTVIQNTHLNHLIQDVNHYLKQGWQSQGGVCYTRDLYNSYYFQALIRETEIR